MVNTNRARAIWDAVRTSLWLVPSVMILAAAGLAWAMLAVDAGKGGEDDVRAWWMNSGSGEDARNLLSSLLTGVISMASMAFSATVVVLTLAASQYGPRLIRVFRADFTTQATLGTFAMTIVYLVLVLRAVRGDAEFHDVPHAAISLGTVLALGCVLALLVFIQELSTIAVANEVVARVGREFDEAIEHLPRLENDAETELEGEEEAAEDLWRTAAALEQRQEGYVQSIDHDALLAWADQHGAMLRLDFRAGDFVVAGDRRILVWPAEMAEAAERDSICELATVGRERTPTQDLEFAVRHLVEVAVRALSPGINDPATAIAVVDRLRGCLSRLAGRQLPRRRLRDAQGRLRVMRQTTTFAGTLDAAFNQIRQAAAKHPAVVIHLLEAIARIAEHGRTEEQCVTLAQHARMVAAAGLREASEPRDRHDIERALENAEGKLRPEEASHRVDRGTRLRATPGALLRPTA
ncbi:DUF2254 domain-containing protein [Sabulicella glaciei]|uniref:DUF2254 domain-containing protein n=1 Tax=Sabulicella glaciei TaxID=2984948 RepID=A0ABT3P075_9PROT|nr:DUF2254 domain-containing protein [Roseococcus sp. MDT2-1-1]MCW8087808.1 DUF2254 domain-containing protein [Roseococcus sp. MDT2-1-1]